MTATTAAADLNSNRTGATTWDGQPLLSYDCLLGELAERLPRVDRRRFELGPPMPQMALFDHPLDPPRLGENAYYDLIVRCPDQLFRTAIPIGVVSKTYRLVQHHELVEGVIGGLKSVKVPWEGLQTTVRMTELGSRLHFTVFLPPEFREKIAGDDGLELTLECLNSVDRSWAFRVSMGWFRVACANGMFVGQTAARLRHAHVESLDLAAVPALIQEGLKAAKGDAAHWQARARLTVARGVLLNWADDVVTHRWGVLAAARVLLIARTGMDGRFTSPAERSPASLRSMTTTDAVPGSEPPNNNVYRIGQILAWLANRRDEWGARLELRRQVPTLLAPLVRDVSNQRKRRTIPVS